MNDRIDAFRSYAEGFLAGADPDCAANIRLKIGHSLRVLGLARSLAATENFAPREKELLELAALYHDLARFEQYSRFHTFNDLQSFDHGDRGAELLGELGLLAGLPEEEAAMVSQAVRVHNKLAIPDEFEGSALKIAQALRDCDKIDIMPITIEFIRRPENMAVVWNLEKGERLTPAVASALRERRSPAYSDLRSALDFLASKLAWQYDLNFEFSRRKFKEGRFMEQIREFLPDSPEINSLL